MGKKMKNRLLAMVCAAVLAVTLMPASHAAGQVFTDVKPGDWYYNMVSEMVDEGMISGFPDGSFQPNRPITRVELAAIALKAFPDAAITIDYDPDAALEEVNQTNPGFWGNQIIRDAALRGIYIFGTTKEEWAKPATRGEVAGILVTLYDGTQDEPLEMYEEAALLIGDYETAVAGHNMELTMWEGIIKSKVGKNEKKFKEKCKDLVDENGYTLCLARIRCVE